MTHIQSQDRTAIRILSVGQKPQPSLITTTPHHINANTYACSAVAIDFGTFMKSELYALRNPPRPCVYALFVGRVTCSQYRDMSSMSGLFSWLWLKKKHY